jgi:hypothetical protein
MTGDPYRVEAYWRPRAESARACASRFACMLAGLAAAHPALVRWNKKAWSRTAANKPAWMMPPDVDELTNVFERGRIHKDVPHEPWPEMGYSVSAWNGRERPYGASLTVRPGGYIVSRRLPNTVDLVLNPAAPGNVDLVCSAVLKSALLSVATAWEPDYAVVVGWDYWQRSFGDRGYPLFRSGWMTYLAPQYASRITPPPPAIVEPVPGGGLLLLATEEQFSMDNPAHLATADAIQAALAPIQSMVPSGRLQQRPTS